jgi:hypothetical protein
MQETAANIRAIRLEPPGTDAMTATITTFEASDQLLVLGETLRPLLTNAMGSSIEIFRYQWTSGLGSTTPRSSVGRDLCRAGR